MLALSRKKNEALVINNNIEITILEIKGEQVKIGISAPKEVPVYRKEVYVQIKQMNEAAADTEGLVIFLPVFGPVLIGHVLHFQFQHFFVQLFIGGGIAAGDIAAVL